MPVVDLGVCEYISEEPSSRFPVYTRGNAGEVWPEVVYPLSIGLARGESDDPYAKTVLETGLMTEADVVDGVTTWGGVFGGYMYLNLSMNRTIAIRTLGTTIEDNDRVFLGSSGVAPPHEPHRDDKSWRASLRGLRYGWKMLKASDVPHVVEDRAYVTSWQERLPGILDGPDEGLVAAMHELTEPTLELFAHHIEITGKAGASLQLLTSICDKNLDDGSRALTLLGGLGEVDSATPSFELWRLGRMVRADGALTAQFDAGMDGLYDRLVADPAAATFVADFESFQQAYGSRGPNEWETACETWGTEPALPLAFVDRMRLADDGHDPALKRADAAAAREAAREAALSRLGGPTRWLFRRVLDAGMLYSPARERSKTIIVDLIHVGRLITRELGRRCAARVEGGTIKDLWFVFPDELDDYIADPTSMSDAIAVRRAAREELVRRVPPFVFEGTLPSPETWPLRTGRDVAESISVGDVLTGLGGCAGVAEGRARIVTDPGEPGDIGPGDVLVAPLTDPAWTPLFVPVDAIVVDVGGQMSHAVIVSRELGRPCVVAATGATERIPDGALIRVDGTAGTVTVLELP